MLNLSSILLFSKDPKSLVDFYSKVFQKDSDWEGGEFHGFTVGAGFLTIGPHDKVSGKNQNPERIMFNFETDNVQDEFERIKDIAGVVVITEPYHPEESTNMWIATFADPDNNYFQLISPMEF